MKRKIVQIDEQKCNGCGLCVNACHEGALKLIDGKAKLVADSYCDGLGACLPACPMDAILIEEREAAAFDEDAVKKHMENAKIGNTSPSCPGTRAQVLEKTFTTESLKTASTESQLRQWPCQIKLVPVNAPYFTNAHLLIAADCTAYAYTNLHQDFMQNKVTLIGCPKLDDIDYSAKLAEILKNHAIKSITVLRMEVPCCGGLVEAVKKALLTSSNMVPWNVVTIGIDGNIVNA